MSRRVVDARSYAERHLAYELAALEESLSWCFSRAATDAADEAANHSPAIFVAGYVGAIARSRVWIRALFVGVP